MGPTFALLLATSGLDGFAACAPVMDPPPPPPPAPTRRWAVPPPAAPVEVDAPPPPVVILRCPPGRHHCPAPAWRYRTPVVRCPRPVATCRYPYARHPGDPTRCLLRYRYRVHQPYRYLRPTVTRTLLYIPPPYHRKSTPYLGVELGHLALFPGASAYRFLKPTVFGSAFFGWNFTRLFALELGLGGAHVAERDGALGGVKDAGLAAVTLDAKLRLIKPSPRHSVVPYLQAGVGAYWFGGKRTAPETCEDGSKGCVLAHGAGLHAGGGLDIYLFRGGVLGFRVLYRHLFLSQLQCAPGTACAATVGDRTMAQLPALTATAHFTLFWSHL